MSRRASAVALCALLCALCSPVAAQSGSASRAVADAREAYGPAAPKPKCPTVPQGEEIVVCAEEQEQSQFRVRSDADAENDYARETMNKGDPKAPDVAGPGIFKGPASFGFGKPPPPAYIVDFAELPDTPPGSDADRVGKGLAPAGDDAGALAATPLAGPTFGGIVTAVPRLPVRRPESASPVVEPSDSQTPPAGQEPS